MSIEIDIVESAPFNSSYNKKIKDKEYNEVGICLFTVKEVLKMDMMDMWNLLPKVI